MFRGNNKNLKAEIENNQTIEKKNNQRSSVKKIIDWAQKLQFDTSYINQGQDELCVAASFCLVVYWMSILYNVGNKSQEIYKSLDYSPCWNKAYLSQRMHEAADSGRCKCDFEKNTCENCGSTITAALSVLQNQGYLSKNNKLRYTLQNENEIVTVPINVNDLMQFLDQGPVVCNMYIRKSQSKFLDSPPNDSYVFGNDKIQSYGNQGVYDSCFEFPKTEMDESREKFGHCVVIVGYRVETTNDNEKIKFRVRNSFGKFWGHFGDFYLTQDHIHPQTIHQLVFVSPSCISIQ
jgi:hypothetical protein